MRSSTITIISSGFLRLVLVTVGGGSSMRTWSAWTPRRPSATPNSTRCPARSTEPAGRAEEWTNTSPPSSRVRKPNPLSASYHLTLPVGTDRPHAGVGAGRHARNTRSQVIGPVWLTAATRVHHHARRGRVLPSPGRDGFCDHLPPAFTAARGAAVAVARAGPAAPGRWRTPGFRPGRNTPRTDGTPPGSTRR